MSKVNTFPNLKDLRYRFNSHAINQYKNYEITDYRYIKKIRQLVKSIRNNGHQEGLGHPKFLKSLTVFHDNHPLDAEEWSRHVTHEDRLVYLVVKELNLFVVESCKTHYAK